MKEEGRLTGVAFLSASAERHCGLQLNSTWTCISDIYLCSNSIHQRQCHSCTAKCRYSFGITINYNEFYLLIYFVHVGLCI